MYHTTCYVCYYDYRSVLTCTVKYNTHNTKTYVVSTYMYIYINNTNLHTYITYVIV